MNDRAHAVVVAAGQGTRFGSAEDVPKALQPVAGVPMYLRALGAFDRHPRIDGCVLVFPLIWEGQILEQIVGAVDGPVELVPGGRTRRASVSAGIDVLGDDVQAVVVHDAARPIVEPTLIDAVLDGLRGADAAVPVIPVADTIKRVEGDRVRETVARDGLARVQTPQAFRLDVLRRAHREVADGGATDDAVLIERSGGSVVAVAGDERNIKITTRGDLLVAEALLRTEVSG